MTRILQPDSSGLAQAVHLIHAGEPVAIPTETVYGLSADALNPDAVLKIFESKERPKFDPLIVHVADTLSAGSWLGTLESLQLIRREALSSETQALAEKLMAEFWPGPLTFVLPKDPKVPDLVTSGLDSVAIRVPAHPIAQALLRQSGRSLAAPSANRFGRISPTCAEHVLEELNGRIALILDGGPCAIGVESTVIAPPVAAPLGANDRAWRLLRPGGVAQEKIEKVLGQQLERGLPISNKVQVAPGMLASHYAPTKPLTLIRADEEVPPPANGETLALLFTDCPASAPGPQITITASLSSSGNAADAARNLFSILRKLDASNASRIVAKLPVREDGLWSAIVDRLRRAAVKAQ